ncbi:MAG TPA: mechanosensitive ion channel domain-containing protein [Thermoanaerobaculia bacterium]|nr:mechanosensitive ion channel domain-containing protein [Thermoanaerobaculia bacterium]
MSQRFHRWSLAAGILLLGTGLGFGLLRVNQVRTGVGRIGANARDLWSQPLFDLGDLPVSPAFLVKASIFLILLNLLSRAGRRLLETKVLARTSIDEGQKYALARGFGYLVFLLGLIAGLQSAGLDLSSFALVGGAIGIGIGFGLQSLAKDFVSGLILLVEHGVKVGDRVEVGNLIGDVVRIGARTTWVRTNDNVVMIVPNSEMTGRVTNWTAHGRLARFTLRIGVGYGSDPERVREILLEVATANPDVLRDPPPDVVFAGLGQSALEFDLRVWTAVHLRTPQTLKSDLNFPLFRRLREEGIEIPVPPSPVQLLPPPAASLEPEAAPAPPSEPAA